MKVYPVGATWIATEDDWKYEVTLDRLNGELHGKRYEIWYVDIRSDHLDRFEIFSNKSSAIKYCKSYMNDTKNTRFKRVEKGEDKE